MKNKRVVDQELLDTVRNLPCLGCASHDPDGARAAVFENEIRCHPHHLITRGAGGGDVAENVMPLCFQHHRLIHDAGISAFVKHHRVARDWLEGAGWKYNGVAWEEPVAVYGREEVTSDS